MGAVRRPGFPWNPMWRLAIMWYKRHSYSILFVLVARGARSLRDQCLKNSVHPKSQQKQNQQYMKSGSILFYGAFLNKARVRRRAKAQPSKTANLGLVLRSPLREMLSSARGLRWLRSLGVGGFQVSKRPGPILDFMWGEPNSVFGADGPLRGAIKTKCRISTKQMP